MEIIEQEEKTNLSETDKEKGKSHRRTLKEAEEKIKGLTQQIEKLTKALEDKEKELAESQDRFLRLAAEFDNYRKRQEKEINQIVEYAGEEVLRNVLPIVDDLDRAIKSEDNSSIESVHEGMEMIYKKLQKILTDLGVQPIESLDQPFNPDLHHAVMAKEIENVAPEIVVEEFEKGYKYKQRVLRFAKVVVSK